jgi:aldehyde dehydrogenase (NAD+)
MDSYPALIGGDEIETKESFQINVNTYGAGGGVELPFGSFKRSGYGREKGYEALLGYTQAKTVAVKLVQP